MRGLAKTSEIGGGIVRRLFTSGDTKMFAGTLLTPAQIEGMANRRALIRNGAIDIWPAAPAPLADAGKRERHVVGAKGGGFHVVEGRTISDTPMTRARAEEIAAQA